MRAYETKGAAKSNIFGIFFFQIYFQSVHEIYLRDMLDVYYFDCRDYILIE
jgi:hypothetical protein